MSIVMSWSFVKTLLTHIWNYLRISFATPNFIFQLSDMIIFILVFVDQVFEVLLGCHREGNVE